ncbi:MAG TPA: hypothetical protein VGP93_12585, partial [Polyangiaceae bacterium]|nr:hypothetical protein [Polyangiaceae bacterium]
MTHLCKFEARDVDGDGHPALKCASIDRAITISLGDDCDDTDADVYPGAWDGPADGMKPNRCGDGVDQNCSGADGDNVASNGATCACTPNDTSTCSEDSGGIPITWPAGKPIGACKYGVKTCVLDPMTGKATWGACVGAVPPAIQEFCNGGV